MELSAMASSEDVFKHTIQQMVQQYEYVQCAEDTNLRRTSIARYK